MLELAALGAGLGYLYKSYERTRNIWFALAYAYALAVAVAGIHTGILGAQFILAVPVLVAIVAWAVTRGSLGAVSAREFSSPLISRGSSKSGVTDSRVASS
jgi:hypothetical protein